MSTRCLLLLILLVGGCTTGLQRDGHCLASLTPDYLRAQEEVDRLEAVWRTALLAPPADPSSARDPSSVAAKPGSDLVVLFGSPSSAPHPRVRQAEIASDAAYHRFLEAKQRHRDTLLWYDRVYTRVRTRIEEDRILSDARMALGTGGGLTGLLLYPIVRWNVHSVFWDEGDPDDERDPVTRFCADRLAHETMTAGGTGQRVR